LKPSFPPFLRALEALFHPRTEKNVIRLNLAPSKKKATKKFSVKLSKQSLKKPSIFFRLQRKQTPFFLGAFGELDLHIWGAVRPKTVRGAKTDVWQAAHLLFVVRWADFSGKWCTT